MANVPGHTFQRLDGDNWSQASRRSYRIYRDQHGRKWGADVENPTPTIGGPPMPCGPLSARFDAPWYPPEKYLVITDPVAGEITIDYERMIDDAERAELEYESRKRQTAVKMYGNKGHEAVKTNDRDLLEEVGMPPESAEIAYAARAGNPWLLGLLKPDGSKYEMPEEAKPYFPEPVQKKQRGQWGGTPASEVRQRNLQPAEQYPKHLNFGRWLLSNGTEFQGRKEEALRKEKEIAGSREGATAGVDPSWS